MIPLLRLIWHNLAGMALGSGVVQARKDDFKLLNERRQIMLHRCPNNVRVGPPIIMHQYMPHANHLAPGYLSLLTSKIIRHAVCGLANEIDRLHSSQLKHTVVVEVAAVASKRNIARNLRRFSHLQQMQAISFRLPLHISISRY